MCNLRFKFAFHLFFGIYLVHLTDFAKHFLFLESICLELPIFIIIWMVFSKFESSCMCVYPKRTSSNE